MSDLLAIPPSAPVAGGFSYLQGLNPTQRQAVESADGPVLVLAGAGTGKTRVLTTRIAHLLVTRRAAPFQVLAVTFTNKAAREMRERVEALVGAPAEGWWLGTFHALAARMLRRHAEMVGLKSNFTILDTDDQLRLIKQLLEAAEVDSKRWPAQQVLGAIERWKDRALTPDRLKAEDGGEMAGGRLVTLYQEYQDRLRTLNACDFGDLLMHTIGIFQRDPEVLGEYHRKFHYLLVDEYQDTNVAQYLWLRLLAQSHRNLCCVGDEDQSIYGWRGAEIGNILRFEQDFPGAAVIRLEQNYRSTGNILGAASGLIARNKSRLGKTLWTKGDGGAPVQVRAVYDTEEEARYVGDEIEALQRRGVKLSQIAILVRTGFQSRDFEDRFLTLGLPYRVLGGMRFYERQEIRDAVAYLRVIHQPDDDLAFERIVNMPKRGIGPSALQRMNQLSRAQGIPMAEAAFRLSETQELPVRPRTALRELGEDFDRWRRLTLKMSHTDLARQVLDESGYTRMWQTDKSPEAPGRLENLKELINAMAEFENLGGFLEHISLVMENAGQSEGEMISLMTLHGAKGLEFDVVFLPGWEEGLFPNQRALDEKGVTALEEERRLAYVGLTRARKLAYVSYAARRRLFGNWNDALPSRFIGELPTPHIAVHTSPGIFTGSTTDFGGGYGGGHGGGRAGDGPAPAPVTVLPPIRKFPPGPAPKTPAAKAPSAKRAGTVTNVAPQPAARPPAAQPFRVGARVFHQKFGYGTVQVIDRDKLEIAFDHGGVKKVMDSFVIAAEKAG